MPLEPLDLDAYKTQLQVLLPSLTSSGSLVKYQPGSPLVGSDGKTRLIRLAGDLRSRGYALRVTYETSRLVSGQAQRGYKYQISTYVGPASPGAEIIAFETDDPHPPHAHFPPGFARGTGNHFTNDLWPAHLRILTFPKVLELFQTLVKTGILPEPFR